MIQYNGFFGKQNCHASANIIRIITVTLHCAFIFSCPVLKLKEMVHERGFNKQLVYTTSWNSKFVIFKTLNKFQSFLEKEYGKLRFLFIVLNLWIHLFRFSIWWKHVKRCVKTHNIFGIGWGHYQQMMNQWLDYT